MYQFRNGAGAVVAADSQNAIKAVDEALLNGVRMCASIIEATQGSNLPAAQSQRLLQSMTTGISSVVSGRGEIVAAIRQLTEIKGQSNFAAYDFGCPAGWAALSMPATEETPSPART